MTFLDTQMATLQENLRVFVREEHEAQRKALARVWAMPLEQRVEEGRCIAGGRLHSWKPPHGLFISLPGNDSRFRDGDFVRLSTGDPQMPLCEAVVVQAEDEWIELEVWGRTPEVAALEAAAGQLQIDESALDLEGLYLGAIEDLGKTEIGRDKILPLLAGELKPAINLPEFEAEFTRAGREGGFDDEQAKAVASALATDLCWLIHGPPGTGKTRVLAWIVQTLLERGERVLVTGANHRSINHLLEEIARLRGDMRRIFKVAPFPDPSSALKQVRYFSDIPQAEITEAYVIGATPFSLRSRRLSGVDFDTVIIDEASQVSVVLGVMAMLAGQRYILAGDHHQLQPVRRTTDFSKSEETDSIFRLLVNRGMDTMLTITHRLNEPLCEWPSSSFYLSRLRSSPAAAGRRLTLKNIRPELREALLPDPSCVWLAVPHVGSKTSSPEEIEAVSEVLLALREGGISWNEVGVVVPFRRQARLLRQRLSRQMRQPISSHGLIADTVERMQGQEKEVVIVTLAASEPMFVTRVAWFLLQPERLNVAATRARTKLILVASPELLDAARHFPEELAAPFLFLMEQACRVDF